MTDTFFSHLAALGLTGNLNLCINIISDGPMVVSVLLQNDTCGDNARHQLKPLVLKGTPQQLDADFINTISAPLQGSSALMVNMESFLKSQDEAKKQAASQKDKEKKETEERTAKKKTVDEAIKKVDELIKAKRYHEALGKLPKADLFPDFMTILKAKRDEIKKFLGMSGDLFGSLSCDTASEQDASALSNVESENDEESKSNSDEYQDSEDLETEDLSYQ